MLRIGEILLRMNERKINSRQENIIKFSWGYFVAVPVSEVASGQHGFAVSVAAVECPGQAAGVAIGEFPQSDFISVARFLATLSPSLALTNKTITIATTSTPAIPISAFFISDFVYVFPDPKIAKNRNINIHFVIDH